jgi:hypothetical protein
MRFDPRFSLFARIALDRKLRHWNLTVVGWPLDEEFQAYH